MKALTETSALKLLKEGCVLHIKHTPGEEDKYLVVHPKKLRRQTQGELPAWSFQVLRDENEIIWDHHMDSTCSVWIYRKRSRLGVTVLEALQVMRETAAPVVVEHITQKKYEIRLGYPLHIDKEISHGMFRSMKQHGAIRLRDIDGLEYIWTPDPLFKNGK